MKAKTRRSTCDVATSFFVKVLLYIGVFFPYFVNINGLCVQMWI